MDDNSKLQLPADIEGFFLLKCPSCGEKFKMTVEDLKDESTIDIWCPNCGLKHESYLDDDVNELINIMAKNQGAEILNNFLRNLEKSFTNYQSINFNVREEVKKEVGLPIGQKTGDFEIKKYLCCGKFAQINSIKKLEGSYCPFCGVWIDGD